MNLRMVDDRVFRSDQPNAEAWPVFAKAGVQAVMCLRKDGEDGGFSLKDESDAVLAAGIGEFVSIPVGEMPFDAPTEAQVVQGEALLRDGRVWVVHCRRGCDRTGVFVARYRVAAGWTMVRAMAEATRCGMSRLQFRMHEFLEHTI
jgi:protein tyrosine phosphatase (PTP) superfamily phosphohydrolase (DUF442 family)